MLLLPLVGAVLIHPLALFLMMFLVAFGGWLIVLFSCCFIICYFLSRLVVINCCATDRFLNQFYRRKIATAVSFYICCYELFVILVVIT